ncbi:hypothetical protein DFH08DRAFT_954724 [Mycena albidolilacea]|uniref:Uncharacterized protein n=1 Tax=Mycena albidolilacea TaxID=1033008 RepID=A0AAD7ADT9_9AGAR|nr:hypothetical protein DFH08DRAFT_954724 [Mycena albidolilacea]
MRVSVGDVDFRRCTSHTLTTLEIDPSRASSLPEFITWTPKIVIDFYSTIPVIHALDFLTLPGLVRLGFYPSLNLDGIRSFRGRDASSASSNARASEVMLQRRKAFAMFTAVEKLDITLGDVLDLLQAIDTKVDKYGPDRPRPLLLPNLRHLTIHQHWIIYTDVIDVLHRRRAHEAVVEPKSVHLAIAEDVSWN